MYLQKADDFSDFQMKKILKQSSLSLKLDSVRSEMNHQNSGKIAQEFGCADFDSVVVRQLASEEDSHFIFVKGLHKSSALEALEKHKNFEEENSKDIKEEKILSEKLSSQLDENQGDKELLTVIKEENKLICEMKKEKDLVNEEVKKESEADTDIKSSDRYNRVFEVNKSLLFSWAQSVESEAKLMTSPSKASHSTELTMPKKSTALILSDEDDSEDDLELSHSKKLKPENLQQEHSKVVATEHVKTSKDEIKSKIFNESQQNLDSKTEQISSVFDSEKVPDQFKVPKDVGTIFQNVPAVVAEESDEGEILEFVLNAVYILTSFPRMQFV